METVASETSRGQLQKHAAEMAGRRLASLFAEDKTRFERLSSRLGPLLLDFSKQRLTEDTLTLLSRLADDCELGDWISRLFRGDEVNHSEARPAMHWALRAPPDQCGPQGAEILAALDKMETLISRLRSGAWTGATGEVITQVVHIGVGGSDLGPQLACQALKGGPESPELHFVTTMDGTELARLLPRLRPEATLFVVSSKSFVTADTLANAATARAWLAASLGETPEMLARHWVGISANKAGMTDWGIAPEHQLKLWDWVGGRYSLWSTIGFGVALRIGMADFRELLAGAHAVDEHFRSQPWRENIPVLLGLIAVWNRNFLGINNHAVLPYDGRLARLPAYLAQLEMESNGKSVTRDGAPVEVATSPIIWGEVGPNAQHAFYQLLHQGTETVSWDFITSVQPPGGGVPGIAGLDAQHQLTLANCLAQSRLLAFGDDLAADAGQLPPHRRHRGNQPGNTLLLDAITPYSLGMLLSIYEHKVFTEAVIWGINPFDQWGVEKGKEMASGLLAPIRQAQVPAGLDSSTAGLLAAIQSQGE